MTKKTPSKKAATSSRKRAAGSTRKSASSSKTKRGSGSRKGRKSSKKKGLPWFRWAFLGTFWGALVVFLAVVWFSYDLPSVEELQALGRRASITLHDRKGQVIAQSGDLYGTMVQAGNLPPPVKNAILAVEDRRFYSHFGIDIFGLMRAAWANWRAGRVVQGGSTLTQQLAKNFLFAKKLYKTNDRSYRRKIQEVLLSFWLEYNFTKDQILTLYMNRSYFGAGTFGLSAAAQRYFGKEATDLKVYEAAVIAGLLKAPSKYSPVSSPDRADKRAQIVLGAMVSAGFLSVAEREQLRSAKPHMVRLSKQKSFGRYFSDWIMEKVQKQWGHLGEDLIVQTTLDHSLQDLAEGVVFRSDILKSNPTYQTSLVAMTPGGAVRALVGGCDYGKSQFNRATQALRQSGSTFKIVPYLVALEKGWKTTSMISDRPINIKGWSPKNYYWKSRGDIPLRLAFAKSVNTAAVRLTRKVGMDSVRKKAVLLGMSQKLPRDLSIALGSGDTTLLELTGAYSVIANNGFKAKPYGILKVSDRRGNVLYRRSGKRPDRLVSAPATKNMLSLLKEVMDSGTGRRSTLDRPCAGKTGTSQNSRDAWFVGFTPDLVTGIWFGCDNGKPMDSKMTGGAGPAKLWKVFMGKAHSGLPVHLFPR
ncbi:MAG: PBP1A family penicillin-binding protein [bacterium]|nr:PBP1A family penicillin-binding protein [bacterium]